MSQSEYQSLTRSYINIHATELVPKFNTVLYKYTCHRASTYQSLTRSYIKIHVPELVPKFNTVLYKYTCHRASTKV